MAAALGCTCGRCGAYTPPQGMCAGALEAGTLPDACTMWPIDEAPEWVQVLAPPCLMAMFIPAWVGLPAPAWGAVQEELDLTGGARVVYSGLLEDMQSRHGGSEVSKDPRIEGLRRMDAEAPGRHSHLLQRMDAGEVPTSEIDLVMLEDAARWTPEWTAATADAADIIATGEWFVRVFSTVDPRIRVGEPLMSDVRVVLPFWFGEAAEPPPDAVDLRAYLQPADETVKQFVGKNVLVIAAPRENGNWCRTMGIFLADRLFAQLMEERLGR